MKKIGVKFCGGCNPRYDRGEALEAIREACADIATFETASEGTEYDVLLIIRGCTQCQYIYENILSVRRLICESPSDVENVIRSLRGFEDT